MWKISRVEFTNLMSFAEAAYDFTQGVTTVVYGQNKDNDSQQSNGSGKSALLESIAIGITGAPLRKVKNGEVVRNGCKSATISLTMDNPVLKETLRIERIIYTSKSGIVQVYINDKQCADLTTADESNKYVLDLLGISREDLLNYFILSSSRFESFLEASDTKKKEVINRFSNGMIVDDAIEELELDLTSAQEELRQEQASLNILKGKIEVTEDSIREALAGDDTNDTEELKRLSDRLETLKFDAIFPSGEIPKIEKQIKEAEKKVNATSGKSELSKLQAELNKEEEELDIVIKDMSELRKELQENKAEISQLELQIQGTIECPKCEHVFDVNDEKFDVDKAEKKVKELQALQKEIIADGVAAKEDKEDIEASIAKIKQAISAEKAIVREAEDTLIRLKREKSNREMELNRINMQVESTQSLIDNLKNAEKKDMVTPLRTKLAQLKFNMNPVEERVEEVEKEVKSLIELKDIFKRFKTHLANKSIKSIEVLVNDFLEQIGSDITVKLSGFKQLSNGKTTEKIDATLIRDGIELGSFNKNSNGEKARVNLAFILAMNKLITLNAGEGKSIDLLVLDEILDSSDATGLMAMIRALNKVGTTALLVSHGALASNYEHEVMIVKEGGESRIN